MSKGERRLSLSVLCALVLALAMLLFQLSAGAGSNKVYRVSVLLDGADTEYWNNFINGINQAARELNVDVRFLSRFDGDPGEAQADAMRRTWEGETDGLVVIPTDLDAVAEALDDAPANLAVSIIGPELGTDHRICYVSSDFSATGTMLADSVANAGGKSCTVYRPQKSTPASELIYAALTARLSERGVNCTSVRGDPEQIPLPLAGALVAVDPATAEALCRIAGASGRVYGVGTSNRLLHYLEDGAAAGLVVRSDYDAGYLSLTSVVETLSSKRPGDTVLSSYTVTSGSMFEKPLVDFLFSTP